MIRSTWTHPLAAVLALALAQPAVAAQRRAEPTGQPADARRATVEIDTSDIGEEGPVLKRRTRERTDVVLRAAGVLPGRPDVDDPVIHVDIDELTGDEPGYQCAIWVSRGDEVLGERRRVDCTLCTESEIVQRVEATVTELVGLLPAPSEGQPDPADDGSGPDGAAGDDAATDGSTGDGTTSDPTTATDRGTGLGALGKTGAAFIALGAAGAVAGAVLVALPPRVDEDDPLFETDYRPPGIGTLAAGGAVLGTGIVMLVVDRRHARSPRTTLSPTARSNAVGLVWSGRF